MTKSHDRARLVLGLMSGTSADGIDVALVRIPPEPLGAHGARLQDFTTIEFPADVRAAVIPSVAIPVSLVATFGIMHLCGYSLNNLTLMALAIAAGFVVDDAIVVLENTVRHIENGMTPREAARVGAGEVGPTVVAMTLSLVSVFIPMLLSLRRTSIVPAGSSIRLVSVTSICSQSGLAPQVVRIPAIRPGSRGSRRLGIDRFTASGVCRPVSCQA